MKIRLPGNDIPSMPHHVVVTLTPAEALHLIKELSRQVQAILEDKPSGANEDLRMKIGNIGTKEYRTCFLVREEE